MGGGGRPARELARARLSRDGEGRRGCAMLAPAGLRMLGRLDEVRAPNVVSSTISGTLCGVRRRLIWSLGWITLAFGCGSSESSDDGGGDGNGGAQMGGSGGGGTGGSSGTSGSGTGGRGGSVSGGASGTGPTGGSATGGAGSGSGGSDTGGNGGSAGAATGGRGGASGSAGAAGSSGGASGSSGAAGQGGTGGVPPCGGAPWPGEVCENGNWVCRPDPADYEDCPATACASCREFDEPVEMDGCRCSCNAQSTAVTCEEI